MKRWWRWYNIVLTFVLLLSPTFTVLGVEIFVKRKSDLNTVAGARAELVCEVRDLRDELKYCEWFSPNDTRYDPDEEINGIRVVVDSRRDECVLIIESLKVQDSGPWKCSAEDDRNGEASKFVVIQITEKIQKFQLLLFPDQTSVDAEKGGDVEIMCPTNHNSNGPQDRPVCSFYAPSGKKYTLIDKFGGQYDYKDDGIERIGDPDEGQCGIKISKIEFAQSGTWKCEILRKQRPGSTRIGSEVTSAEFRVDVFRTARFDKSPAKLQGYEENDRDAQIVMEVEVDESKEKFTDFYWIVRRSLKVYEGDEACIDSGRRGDNCYEASRKRKIGSNRSSGGSNKGIVKYELSLYIDQIEEEDLEERIFLVKDYREFNSEIDKYETKVVPRTRSSRSIDSEDNLEFARQQIAEGKGCLISREYISIGDFVEYPELCVKLICKKDANVDVRSLEESKCRRRRRF